MTFRLGPYRFRRFSVAPNSTHHSFDSFSLSFIQMLFPPRPRTRKMHAGKRHPLIMPCLMCPPFCLPVFACTSRVRGLFVCTGKRSMLTGMRKWCPPTFHWPTPRLVPMLSLIGVPSSLRAPPCFCMPLLFLCAHYWRPVGSE